MSNPRGLAYEGIAGVYVTHDIDNSTITYSATVANGSAQVGKAVQLSAAHAVALTTDGSEVEGQLVKVEADNRCTVQVGGFMTLAGGSGASLTVGKKIVGAVDGNAAGGYIREVATATAAELGLCRGRIIDAGTATAVIVALD